MIEAILFAKFTTIIFVCIMSFLMGIMLGIGIGGKMIPIWNCKECEHTEDECKDCYPELGYKNDKLKRDTEAVEEFVKSDAFKKLMESLDKQDRAATEDAEQFLRDIKEQEE